MTIVLAVHSHGGGTGKTNLAVNLAAVLADGGRHVCLVDTDVQAPGLQVLLGVDEAELPCTLSEYLLGDCEIENAVYDVTDRLGPRSTGRMQLVPSRLNATTIARIVGGGYDAGLLDEGLRTLTEKFQPDVLLLDTQSSMTNETMVALAAADTVILLMRADEQEYRGAGVAAAIASRLSSPRTFVVVNMVTSDADPAEIRATVESAFGRRIEAIIPHSPEMAELASSRVFVLEHPEHPLTAELLHLAERVVADRPHEGA